MLDLDTWEPAAQEPEPSAATAVDDGLRIINVEQNTPEWHAARAGIPTASEFHKVLSTGRADQPSITRRKYMLRLLGERLGVPSESVTSDVLERGHSMEPKAAGDYEFRTGVAVQEVGFMRRGDIGYSPDRVIVGQRGLVEIKSKKPELQLQVLLAGAMPDEHKSQVQGGLMVSGYDFCDFVSYWPGLPLFVQRIERDEAYIDWLRESLEQFNAELDALTQRMVDQYYGGIRPAT